MKRTTLLAVGFVLLALSIGALSQTEGGTLTFALAKDAVNMDYIDGDDHSSSTIHHLIYDQLVQFDPFTLAPTPEIASSWEWEADQVTLTMRLQQGVTFHNGEPLDAEDVVYSFDRILDEDNASPMRGKFAEWLEDVVAVDSHTIQIVHKFPFVSSFLYIAELHIVPKDLLEDIGREAFGQNPVGSGPFEYVEWIRGERLVLERNDAYWMKKPNLERVVMRPIPELTVQALELETGGIDLMTEMAPPDYVRLQPSTDITLLTTSGSTYYYIAFNMAKAPFNDIRFRKAVYHSVDLTGAVGAVFQGNTATRAFGCLPQSLWASDYEYLRENVALEPNLGKAQSLIQELVDDGIMEKDQEVVIWTPTDDTRRNLGTVLATGMQQASINARTQPTEWGTFIPVLLRDGNPAGDWDIIVLGWTGNSDPDNYLFPMFHGSNAVPGTTSNLALYQNAAVDVLLDQARREPSQATRESLYVEAQRIVLSSYVHIPGFFKLLINAIGPRVQDYILDPQEYVGLCNQWTNVWVRD
jgi:peptide/nickel transport system substrate-binding protein